MNDEFYEDDDTAETPRPRRRRRVGLVLLFAGLAVVLVGCGVIVNLARGVDLDAASAKPTRSAKASPAAPAASADTSSAPPSSAPPPPPIVEETVAPPPVEHTTQPGCQPSRGPKQLDHATVRKYLDTAAGTAFWGTATKPAYADIRVPKRLLYAIAEQESGWQSSIKACDGGIGIMQIMPTTQTFVNGRFVKQYDRNKPTDNVMLGANYLAWLIAYYGDKIAEQHKKATANYTATNNLELLKPVISAYNWGTDGVTPNMGTFPNQQYVDNVLELMNGSHAGLY